MASRPTFPDPLVIHPVSSHKHTFILLHGRGSSAQRFGPTLLETPVHPSHAAARTGGSQAPVTETLRTIFPHAKFVFPTAPPRRAIIYKRAIINQWFDSWHLTEPTKREELQIEGLQETIPFIHELIQAEAAIVGGARNVVLGGLSQGCAAGLLSAMLWEGEPVGAFVGMCGWLPYRHHMEDLMATPEDTEDGFDIFEAPSEAPKSEELDDLGAGMMLLRDELELPAALPAEAEAAWAIRQTPVFLGHGQEDYKVPIHLGREASTYFKSVRIDVTFKDYEGLEHWYSENMLSDLVEFLKNRLQT